MKGQYSLWGNLQPKRKPCEYSFHRYIGQKVRDHRGEHVVAKIEPFYTIYTDNTGGTPHDMIPVNHEEFKEMIDTEIEYTEHTLATSNCDVNLGIARRNIEILYAIRDNGYKSIRRKEEKKDEGF